MDADKGDSAPHLESVVPAACRPLCNEVQSQTPGVYQSSAGSGSLGGGRTLSQLGGPPGLRLSPLPILAKVLRKARIERATLIFVAPKWPAQPWFPDLLELVHVQPVPLQLGQRGLLQLRSGVPHANPQVLHLHAGLLCGQRCLH